MAFCTSLRRRQSFASIIPALTSNGFLKENNLGTHDIAIPVDFPKSAGQASRRQLRFLLLSQQSVRDDTVSDTITRIRRSAAITGGLELSLILLLGDHGKEDATTDCDPVGILAYSRLQVEIFAQPDLSSISILPLATLSKLPILLRSYSESVTNPRPVCQAPSIPSMFDILRQCTMSPPMEESVAYFITDTFKDICELAIACVNAHRDKSARDVDVPSPYFSSSSSHCARYLSEAESRLASKIRKLEDFDAAATMAIMDFWQLGSMTD